MEESKQIVVENNAVVGALKNFSFLLALPLYWHIVFTKLIGFFDLNLFLFVVIASAIMSYLNLGWGVVDWLAK